MPKKPAKMPSNFIPPPRPHTEWNETERCRSKTERPTVPINPRSHRSDEVDSSSAGGAGINGEEGINCAEHLDDHQPSTKYNQRIGLSDRSSIVIQRHSQVPKRKSRTKPLRTTFSCSGPVQFLLVPNSSDWFCGSITRTSIGFHRRGAIPQDSQT